MTVRLTSDKNHRYEVKIHWKTAGGKFHYVEILHIFQIPILKMKQFSLSRRSKKLKIWILKTIYFDMLKSLYYVKPETLFRDILGETETPAKSRWHREREMQPGERTEHYYVLSGGEWRHYTRLPPLTLCTFLQILTRQSIPLLPRPLQIRLSSSSPVGCFMFLEWNWDRTW